MKFWDSSALVPLLVEEPRSNACRALRRSDPSLVVWLLTRLELVSALQRLHREKQLTAAELATTLHRLDLLLERCIEISVVEDVRARAERLLAVHRLTAADSLQLAAALVLAKERPKGRGFVTADLQLARAATAEGFVVMVPAAK